MDRGKKDIQNSVTPPPGRGREGFGSEVILPYNDEESKGEQIEQMFDSIAGTYDPLNHILSFGIDIYWREKGISYLKPFAPADIIDIATGTGDLAISLHRAFNSAQITGIDLSEGMLEVARQKTQKKGIQEQVRFEQQDCLALTFPDNSFDAATIAFGIRNFENIRQGLAEIYRVLKPGGHLMILEFSNPQRFPMKQLYRFYSNTYIPFWGWLLSKDKAAYNYLPDSIRAFPQGKEMTGLLDAAGFTNTAFKTYTSGICSMYTGEKQ